MDNNLSFLANAWKSYAEAVIKYDIHSPEAQSRFWAFDQIVDLVRNKPLDALEVILIILKITDDERVLANLAAGPLEDLLVVRGEEVIDRIIELAISDKNFYALLQGVWGNSIDKAVWYRIQELYKIKH